ncbi:uncharacterized protein [Haliotis cracherodii]
MDFICPADITVVPPFNTNDLLAESICNILNEHLEKKKKETNQPLTAVVPKLLVFRPSGRAGDEFEEHVSPHLMELPGVKWYLIIASSPKPADLFDISEGDIEKLQDLQTRVVINGGRLVTKSELYHGFNSTELRELAKDICMNYKNVRDSPQATRWETLSRIGKNILSIGKSPKSSETSRYTLDALSEALTSGKTLADNLEEETVQRMRKILEDINTNVDKKMIEIIPFLQQYMDHIMGSLKKPQREPARNQNQAPGLGPALVPAPAEAQAQAQALNPDPPVPPTDPAPSPDHDHTPIQDQDTAPASSPGYDHAPTHAPATYPGPPPDCDHTPTHAPATDPAPSPDFDHIKIHRQTLLLLKIMIILQLMILLYILVLL